MILVKLYRREGGLMAEAGTLEFYGMPVTKADGSSWIETVRSITEAVPQNIIPKLRPQSKTVLDSMAAWSILKTVEYTADLSI